MSYRALVDDVKQFCVTKTQEIIAELQSQRFMNQGAFNGNEEWQDNSPLVVKDKGFNEPLVDQGDLERDLLYPEHWNLNPVSTKNKLVLTIPEEETFTESKYDKLQTGGESEPYISIRGNKMPAFDLPARNFKKLSKQDADWIVKRLVEELTKKYAG